MTVPQDALHATWPLWPGDQLAEPMTFEDEGGAPIDVAGVWTCEVTDLAGSVVVAFTVSIVGPSTDGVLLLSLVGGPAGSGLITQGMWVTLVNTSTQMTWARWAVEDLRC